MILKFTAACAALAMTTLVAFAGEPEGRYSVVGSNPGGGPRYTGTVTVEKTGQTYKVTWNIGGEVYVGTGIGSTDGLAVSYRSGNQSGLAIYGAKDDNWEGVWAWTDGRTVGGEAWTRQ